MSEWSKEHAWKACVRVSVPRVRIPLSPPFQKLVKKSIKMLRRSRLGLFFFAWFWRVDPLENHRAFCC